MTDPRCFGPCSGKRQPACHLEPAGVLTPIETSAFLHAIALTYQVNSINEMKVRYQACVS